MAAGSPSLTRLVALIAACYRDCVLIVRGDFGELPHLPAT